MAVRFAEVQQFNGANRWRKRGLAVTPTKFGISFTALFMNQVCACVRWVVAMKGGAECKAPAVSSEHAMGS